MLPLGAVRGLSDLKFASRETGALIAYLQAHPEISDLLVTGGDPMVMRTKALRRTLEPLLDPRLELEHLDNIRIGTKSVAYWPQRYVHDKDADDLLRFFEQIVASGRHLTIMAHYNHPRELSTEVARKAIARIRSTGAQIRMQSPLIRRINDSADAWAELWRTGVSLGCVPYYMFIERDTGPKGYFEVPLVRAWEIFRDAYSQVSGLARTVRGPSMSAFPGKVAIDGVTEVAGEKVFALQFLQARDPSWVRRPFFAAYDPRRRGWAICAPPLGASVLLRGGGLRGGGRRAQARAQALPAHPSEFLRTVAGELRRGSSPALAESRGLVATAFILSVDAIGAREGR
nr:hypothetical protein [Pseudenhygromyxa sp. WMMC2535]